MSAEHFARVPEALVFDRRLSDGAVRLWAALDRHSNDARKAWPSRARLAEILGCSRDTVDRRAQELVDTGWVIRTRRRDASGDLTSSLFVLVDHSPQVAASVQVGSRKSAGTQPHGRGDRGRKSAGTGSRKSAALNQSHSESEPVEDLSHARVARKTAASKPSDERFDDVLDELLARKLATRQTPPDDVGAWSRAVRADLKNRFGDRVRTALAEMPNRTAASIADELVPRRPKHRKAERRADVAGAMATSDATTIGAAS